MASVVTYHSKTSPESARRAHFISVHFSLLWTVSKS